MKTKVVCIGAGPAGLTASYLLTKEGVDVTVLEKDPVYVGGISKTVSYKGFCFDIGGHRFFSKSQEVEDLWQEILGEDFLKRPRKSRIYYKNKFFNYPLTAMDALTKLGVIQSILCVLSYVKARLFPIKNPRNFEEWVTNKFGKRLFSIFFKTYTEKVWGMSCKEISADWAAQRIKGLSLASAIKHALLPKKKAKNKGEVIKTLIDTFHYPRKGPGMMWEAAARKTLAQGGHIHMGCSVTTLSYDEATKLWNVEYIDAHGKIFNIEAEHIISTMPIRELINGLRPAPSPEVIEAANNLRYRDFLIVALILKDRHLFDDNWIYIHDPSVKVGRIQNFKSWSEEMVPDQKYNCFGMEYFCFEGDGLWSSSDADLKTRASEELVKLGMGKLEDIEDAYVIRQQKAYPVYDDKYAEYVEIIKTALADNFPNLHLVGRNGMHKYNNQDHAMMTAMLTVKNIMADKQLYDIWNVNQDAEYHESGEAGDQKMEGGRLVPRKAA